MTIAIERYGALLAQYLRPQWRRAALLAVLLFGTIGLQLLNPQILRWFIDAAKAGDDVRSLVTAGALFLGLGVLNQLLSTWATYVGADVGWTATNRLREHLAAHCLSLDMSFHNERPGELIERIDGDITALANFFSQFIVRVVGSGLLATGVLILLYVEDWRAGVALTVYAIGAVTVMIRNKSIAVASATTEREASAGLYGFVEERLAGIDDIRANGGGAYVMNRFHRVLRDMFHAGRKAWMMRALIWTTVVGLFTIGDVISLGIGIWLFQLGAITLGTVYLFFQYTQMMWGVVEQLTQQLQDLQKAGASIGRVEELLAIRSKMPEGHGAVIPEGPLTAEFDGVTFAYGGGDPTLRDISFTLGPGTVLGLLGRTGSGKTTLTRLLFRLYDPTAGTIRLNGVDLREPLLEELRRNVAMVTQEVQLFHATVRDNLTFFDRSIPDERIAEVIAELGLTDWYASMPQGLDTQLTAGGGGLSAGQGQLLAFTRIFLQNPGLLILDEPSSRMDLATERLLEKAMMRLLRNRTAIIIAHRLSTVAHADEIMILEGGHIREHGRRSDLAGDERSRFYSLLQTGLDIRTTS